MNKTMRDELKAKMGKVKAQPLLALAYKSAVMSTCGVPVRIAHKSYPPLQALQKKLDDLPVAYETYAYAVVKMYWPWCRDKGMRTVPLRILCGKAAWKRFTDLLETTVDLPTEHQEQWAEMVHAELNAARMYIGAQLNRRLVSIGQIRKMSKWPEPIPDVVAEVERLLAETYGVSGSYDEIIMALMKRRKQ